MDADSSVPKYQINSVNLVPVSVRPALQSNELVCTVASLGARRRFAMHLARPGRQETLATVVSSLN